jgi:tubulin monoglycylase TTLL3/8
MIDEDYKCWLIEVNTNPCIEVNCPVLAAVIPGMLDNAFTVGLDGLISPPIGKVKVAQGNYLF